MWGKAILFGQHLFWAQCASFFCRGSVFFQGGAGLAEVQGGEALVVVSSEDFKKSKGFKIVYRFKKKFKEQNCKISDEIVCGGKIHLSR